MVRISANDFFFGDPLNVFFFSNALRTFFLGGGAKLIEELFFFYNIVLQGKCKKNSFRVKFTEGFFFSETLLNEFFFSAEGPNEFFFCVFHHSLPDD